MTALLLLLAAAAAAETGPEVLRRAPGARPHALGGAFVAVADDAHAVAWNPAGLGLIRRESAFVSRYGFTGTDVESAGWARPYGTGGVGARLDVAHGSRSAAKAGAVGSTRLTPRVHGGLGLSWARASEAGRSADALLLDPGLLVAGIPGVLVGLSAQNVGLGGLAGPLPENIRLGTAVRFAYTPLRRLRGLTAGLEIDYARHRRLGAFSLGGEYRWRDWAARLGLSAGPPELTGGKTIALGFGWRKWGVGVDYTFAPARSHGDHHRLGLTYEWGWRDERPVADYLLELTSEEAAEAEPVPKGVHLVERRFERAERHLREGHPKLASRELDRVRELLDDSDPRALRYFEAQGRALLALSEWAPARAVYVEGIRVARKLGIQGEIVAHLYGGLGEALAGEGRRAEAIRFLEAALKEGPAPERRGPIEDRLLRLKYVP
ncbi:MAG: tetratricopeptide repeat protein [Elusimicrobia bacterium]|nr:tetratricopeptide repeat protein [Elusimicrobiota bacterium]